MKTYIKSNRQETAVIMLFFDPHVVITLLLEETGPRALGLEPDLSFMS